MNCVHVHKTKHITNVNVLISMLKSYKFRLYPAREQETVLVKTLDVCRHIYNEFLADRRNAYDRCNQGLSCGLEFDRDINAAINILNLGTVGTTGRSCVESQTLVWAMKQEATRFNG